MKMCCTGERCASLSRVKEMRVRELLEQLLPEAAIFAEYLYR